MGCCPCISCCRACRRSPPCRWAASLVPCTRVEPCTARDVRCGPVRDQALFSVRATCTSERSVRRTGKSTSAAARAAGHAAMGEAWVTPRAFMARRATRLRTAAACRPSPERPSRCGVDGSCDACIRARRVYTHVEHARVSALMSQGSAAGASPTRRKSALPAPAPSQAAAATGVVRCAIGARPGSSGCVLSARRVVATPIATGGAELKGAGGED